MLGGRDVTEILQTNGIDVATFGHFDDKDQPVTRDLARVPAATRRMLTMKGLFDGQGDDSPVNPGAAVFSRWTVHLQYHWPQTFPAHSIVHIRHEYSPAVGFQPIQMDAFKKALAAGGNSKPMPLAKRRSEEDFEPLMSFCPDPSILRGAIHTLEQEPADSGFYTSLQWVDFILTSANTWKKPIEDFTLIIERGKPVDGYGRPIAGVRRVVSFCSPENSEVKRIDPEHFAVHLTNFIPKSELHIGFFDFDLASTATKAQSTKK